MFVIPEIAQLVTAKNVEFIAECVCGAITIKTSKGQYSCNKKNLKHLFPNLDLRSCRGVKQTQKWVNCDHCVNHYGLDLCSCGSGERVGECDCGSTKPMQRYGEYERVSAADSLNPVDVLTKKGE